MNTIKNRNRVPNFFRLHLVASTSILTCFLLLTVSAQEYLPGIEWEEPAAVTPGKTNQDPPSDAVILFNGVNTSGWNNAETWKVTDGSLIVGRGMISTKETFGDCQLHVEWSSPLPAKGTGQGRGNSGVFFGPYEIQVLDSFENATYFDGQAAAIYKQTPPLVNAMRKPGEWNSYDIIWKTPRFDAAGNLTEPATVTVLHNGVLVQNNFELLGDTPYNRPPPIQSSSSRTSNPASGPQKSRTIPKHLGSKNNSNTGNSGPTTSDPERKNNNTATQNRIKLNENSA